MRVPALLLALTLATGSSAQPMARNFSFRRPTPLTTIFETFAKLGDFNVLVHPAVRGNQTLELMQVSPREAMHMVAQVLQLTVHRLKNEGKETYIIAQRDVIHMSFGRETRMVRLRHQPVEAIYDTLVKSFETYLVRTQKLATQNTLILQGDSEGLDQAERILRWADVPSPLLQIELLVERDGRPVWKTSLKGRSGRELRAVVGPEDDGRSSTQYLTVTLGPRVSPDRRVALDASITLAPRGDAHPERELFNQVMTAAEVIPYQLLDLASIQAPNGQILKFRVMVSLLETEPAPDLDTVPLSAIDLEPGAMPGPGTSGSGPSETLGDVVPSTIDVIDIDGTATAPDPEQTEELPVGSQPATYPLEGQLEPIPEPSSDDLGDLGDLDGI